MGCLNSKPFSEPAAKDAKEAPAATNGTVNGGEASTAKQLKPLLRPDIYKDKRPSFYAAYARAARRYGFESGQYAGFAKRNNVVVKVRGLEDKGTDHEVPATSIQNVSVGTPGVTVNLDFDTGSSDLWIWSSELADASKYSKTHNIYDPRASSSAKVAEGLSWNISYGDGSSASGNVYTDTVTVAEVTIPNQSVEAAEKLSESFVQDGGNDGLLGLAWPSINTVAPNPVKTPVENMIEQSLISEPLFTVNLGHETQPSFYSFGYIDPTVTSKPLTYTPVDNSQGFWQVPSTSYSINGTKHERSGNTTILDTGTTLLLVADSVVKAIYDSIEGAVYDEQQGGWKYPNSATVPDVSFAVGDQLYTVHPSDFGFGPADEGFTFGGIQSRGDMDFDIFGDVFLKNVYVVFNQGQTQVGLAQRED
ncbi:hypothetical protein NM688_g1778 [Phlebia brevispora]|uniref:Uncharacterized protein n=1 Tax=Phlebia brevispora TaxID=194682 RepID=A0ACC1TA51_9APHY|nr:hypothetical protein NM688_g1778 [Phlebia brevispora]